MEIKFNVLDRQFQKHQTAYEETALRVMRSGWYILGDELECFEQKFAAFTKTDYCVGLNSGLDALILAIRALNIGDGDEVIVPANTYIATILAITENRAVPILVEPDEYYNIDVNKIEEAITDRTKAILVVHLYGQSANMEEICNIAKSHKLYLIEDCAQSHASEFAGKMTGTFGDIGCFSFFPTKNLGAFGDAGAIITNQKEIAEKFKMLRNYGSSVKYVNQIEGVNSRLDELQAALLNTKLDFIMELTEERIRLAQTYLNHIKNKKITLPQTLSRAGHVWHLFVVRTGKREEFAKYLSEHNIQTQIHYPIPAHLQECYKKLGYKKGDFPITEEYAETMLSLPLYIGMTDDEINYVIDIINRY